MSTELYSDFKRDFSIHPVKKNLLSNKNEQAVIASVKNLLFTGPYERRFRPLLSAGLQKYLFENVSPLTASLIRTSIIKTIQTYEPRAILLDVLVTVNEDYNSYSATVVFRIINNSQPITFTAILERIR